MKKKKSIMKTRQAESGGGGGGDGGGRSAAHASQINVHYLQSVKSELPFSVVKLLPEEGDRLGVGWVRGCRCRSFSGEALITLTS